MFRTRPTLRRLGLLGVALALLSGLLALPAIAATGSVTGTLSYREKVALTPAAVAIVTIIDTTAAPDAGAVVGQQRIDAPSNVPIDFSVLVDQSTIDPTHAYALFATITDGRATWENQVGEPVMTGGPTKGIDLVLTSVQANPGGIVSGAIVPPANTALTTSAVAIAALIKVETGTLVARQVRPVTDPTALSYTIGFDPSVIDPAATYVVKGGIVDSAAVWQNRDGVTAISGGTATPTVDVPVTLAPTGVPVPSTLPSVGPSATAAPTAAPTAEPTAEPTAQPTAAPSATPEPTATAAPTPTPAPTASPTPTAAPTPSPSPSPSPSPTPTPSPSPSPTPTPSPSPTPTPVPSGVPTPTPITGPVTGTLTYAEPHQPSGDAFAVVALVRGSAQVTDSSIVASEFDRDITSVPVSFSLDLGSAVIDPSSTYTIQATIVDGDNAWVTTKGVPVLTKGNPSTVAITLAYRPDVLKGAVTGQVTAVGLEPTATAYSMTVLVDPATGESLGIDVRNIGDGLPAAFSVPYSITDIQPNKDYVVTAEVGDEGQTWRNVAGVPVITNGNPKSGVQIVVTPVAVAAPSASPAPTASPAPSTPPVPDSGRSDSGGLLTIIILVAAAAAVAAFFIARGRSSTDEFPPPATDGAPGADAAAGAAAAGAAGGAMAEPTPDDTVPDSTSPDGAEAAADAPADADAAGTADTTPEATDAAAVTPETPETPVEPSNPDDPAARS